MRNKSILNRSVQELVSIDIDELRSFFIDEINELSSLSEEERDERIKFMFDDLFKIQPHSLKIGQIYYSEQRLFADLISVEEFYTNPYIRNYLEKGKLFTNGQMIDEKIYLLKKVFKFYDESSQEKRDKFNYLFRGNASVEVELLSEDVDFKFDMICTLMDYFDKEDLSQVVKFSFNDRDTVETFRSGSISHKELFVISAMNKKIGEFLGNTNNFLEDVAWCYSCNSNLGLLIRDFYDKYIGSGEKEEELLIRFLKDDDFLPLTVLMESIMSHEIAMSRFYYLDDFDEFLSQDKLLKEEYHNIILDTNTHSSMARGTLDVFKKAFLYNVYGMKPKDVTELVKLYGAYLDDTFEDVFDGDIFDDVLDVNKRVFFILKALKDIDKLSFRDDNCEEKVRFLQNQYINYIRENGLGKRNRLYSSVVLDGLFSKMFINTYNKRLLGASACHFVEKEEGVSIFDSGNNFHIMLTSLEGVYGRYYDENVNMASKWNTAFSSTNQGISMSCITNESVGVFSLKSPLLGFDKLPDYSLNMMGISDIYSSVEYFNLRNKEIGDPDYKRFVPASIIDDETRYGYNEFVVERFLKDDKDGKLKIQPSYVVFYKFDDDYKDSDLYKASLKVAKDFGIPILMVDIPKLKENEEREINLMKEELLSGNDPSKIKDVLVRYMNNYTGSLVLTSSSLCNYGKDFSINGMNDFFYRLVFKIRKMDDAFLKKQWIDSLEKAYLSEKEKYAYARGVREYRHSVKEFVLGKYKIDEEVNELRRSLRNSSLNSSPKDSIVVFPDGWIIDENRYFNGEDYEKSVIKVSYDDMNMVLLSREDYKYEIKTIVELSRKLNLGVTFNDREFYHYNIYDTVVLGKISGDDDLNKVSNLVMAYFFECDNNVIDNLIDSDFKVKPTFKCTDSKFNSEVDENLLGILNKVIEKVEEIPNEEFLVIFGNVISKYASSSNKKFEEVACCLLDKKNNMRNVFIKKNEDSIKK